MNLLNRHYEMASEVLPGGVSATARTNRALGHPLYVSRGEGAYVIDLDGCRYVDMCMSHGASLLGHNRPEIRKAVEQALDMGVICSYETTAHLALAQRITELIPCAEMVRFAGSGTETVMHGLRLARSASGREKILKFEGHFHGYADALNFSVSPPQPGSPPHPESSGIPQSDRENILVTPFNDPDALTAIFDEFGDEIGVLMLEPVNYDQGCILPQPGFLELCRHLCDEHGALLFFDEVLTAFRMHPAGAQGYFGVVPDLCVLGKAFGGGMPISVLAGRRHVMEHLRPLGDSEMSGTFLAHPTTVTAALAALEIYSEPGFYDELDATGEHLYAGLRAIFDKSSVPVQLQALGARFGLYFGVSKPVTNYQKASAKRSDLEDAFIRAAFEKGVYFAISPHHGFSAAHGAEEVDRVLEAAEHAISAVESLYHQEGHR